MAIKNKLTWLLALLLLLSLPVMACNLSQLGQEDPTPAPASDDDDDGDEESSEEEADSSTEAGALETENDTEEVESAEVEEVAEETNDEEAAPAALPPQAFSAAEASAQLGQLDSYRLTLAFSFTVNDETQRVTADVITVTDPEAVSMEIAMEGIEGTEGFEQFSVATVDGATYTSFPDLGCMTADEAEGFENPFAELVDAETYLEDVNEAQLIGEETVNGIETIHYTFDETTFEQESSELESAQGDIYVAKGGGYLVRMVMDAEGVLEGFDDGSGEAGTIHVEMNLNDVNQITAVTIPADCEMVQATDGETTGGADSEAAYPILEDATGFSSFGGIVTYSTETPFNDILLFYEDALTAAGWTQSNEESFVQEGTIAFLIYTMENRILNLTVSEDSNTEADDFLVVIFEEEE